MSEQSPEEKIQQLQQQIQQLTAEIADVKSEGFDMQSISTKTIKAMDTQITHNGRMITQTEKVLTEIGQLVGADETRRYLEDGYLSGLISSVITPPPEEK